MAYKQKINPRTGKFNLVTPEQEGGIKEVTSVDESVEVNPSGDGVDLSVPLVTEENHGRERKFDKLVRDHSFMNVISVDSSASFATAAEANQSLMDADPEYYPVAGQTIRFIGNDGRMHDYRYNGNYIIDRNGTNNWWCGACYDVANHVWLINRNSSGGTQMKSGRSASGMFWSITDYPESPSEKRVMMASASFGSAVMSGNSSAEYEFTAYGGDETWLSRALGSTSNYHSLKRATILVNNVATDVLLFINTGATRYLPSSLNDALFVNQSTILNSLGYNVTISGNDGDLADDVDVFIDENGKENLFIFWIRKSDASRHITWVRRNDNNGWDEVDTYTFASGAKVRKCDYRNGFLYCYIGDLGATSLEADAYVLSTSNDTITLLTTYTDTNILIPTAYGVVRIVGYKQIYVDNTLVTLPTTLAANQYLTTAASDGNKAVLIVTGGLQYTQQVGNYAFMLDAEKRKITNDAEWEELPIMTEENHGIVTVEDAVIKPATYDEYLKYTKSDRKLSAEASDRTTQYQNYKIKGTDHEDLWCAVTIAEMVDGTTKAYSDEECTIEAGTITAHSYNPNNPLDLTVAIDGTNYRFEYVESKIPVSLATTKALLSLSPTGSGMTQSADNATDAAFHNLAEHLNLIGSQIWGKKTWNGLNKPDGKLVWTDGTGIYYSSGTSQYVLDKSTSTWSAKTWNGLSNFDGNRIWRDGTNIYFSNGSDQYVLTPAILSDSEFAFRRSASDTWQKVKMSDIEKYINKEKQRQPTGCILIKEDSFDVDHRLYTHGTIFILDCPNCNMSFYLRESSVYTQSNPFVFFGKMSKDGGSFIYFYDNNEYRYCVFESDYSNISDWNSPCMFEFWTEQDPDGESPFGVIAYLRITSYPDGYDGTPVATDTISAIFYDQ